MMMIISTMTIVWIISLIFRGDEMEILLASVTGYLLGGASVLLTLYLLYDKVQPKPAPEPEAKAREEPAESEPEQTPEEKRYRAELQALWDYDAGLGGVTSGDKENS